MSLDAIAARWPAATVNLMTTYLPFGPAERPLAGSPELARINTDGDVHMAIAHASEVIAQLLIDGKRPR